MKTDTPIFCIASRINLIVEIIGLPPALISKETDIDARHLKRVLSGLCEPNYKTIHALITRYDVSANWLIKGTGSMFSKYSKLNSPADCPPPAYELPSVRYTASLTVLACLDLWLSEARYECYKKMENGHQQFIDIRTKIARDNIGLKVSLEAKLTVNRTKYTINNSMTVLP